MAAQSCARLAPLAASIARQPGVLTTSLRARSGARQRAASGVNSTPMVKCVGVRPPLWNAPPPASRS
eukprot:5248957-Lingulodinium_polyedra.AAC.1